jgi:hypothetical protein
MWEGGNNARKDFCERLRYQKFLKGGLGENLFSKSFLP